MDQHTFLFNAFVYLAAAVVMVPLAKKLGLGSVLGYLLAGVLIGPAALGFISTEGADIMHFAEFGVVMMLFLIGLELEPALLWKLRKPIIGMGGLQVSGTAIIIFLIALLFKLPLQQALALGLILALSSTAIALQTLQEKSLLKTAAGQSSFSVLLFQDIAVIPMLALMPLLQNINPQQTATESHEAAWIAHLPAWQHAMVVLGAVVGIIVAGRYAVRPLFKLIAATRLREIFTATALLIVVGIAVLMTQVGLSPALGTFLAGVVLANSEYKHELESDIEPFKGLLLGLFFVAVGASINFTLIMEEPLLIVGLVLGLMLLKAALLFLLGKMFKLTSEQSLLFAVALCQIGEFAFVLFSFTAQAGILPQNIIEVMIAVVAISMALSPLLLVLFEKVVQPRLAQKVQTPKRPHDAIDEDHPVIIAGFGHFGSTLGRFLRAHRIGLTILDSDPDRVDLLRRMGFKVHYGDASRYDLLHAAGAAKAKLIIITLEPADKRMELIDTVKKHFPELRMLVRATNRYDAYDQMNAGMLHIYRETMHTALRVGVDAMRFLGHRAYTAERAARLFYKLDEANLKKLSAIRDLDEYVISAREKIEELEAVLQQDLVQSAFGLNTGWDEEGLIAEANRS